MLLSSSTSSTPSPPRLLPHSTSSPAPVLLHGLYSSTVVTSLPLEEVGREDVALCSLALPGHQYTRQEQVAMLQDNSEFNTFFKNVLNRSSSV